MRHGERITIRRPWGMSREVEFAGIVHANSRKVLRIAYRAQVFWPTVGGLYDVELEHGRLMRTATKPFDPPWIVVPEALDELVRMAQAMDACAKELRKTGAR